MFQELGEQIRKRHFRTKYSCFTHIFHSLLNWAISLYTHNHQELYNDKRGGLVFFMDFLIIKPLRSEFYFENIKLSY